MERRQPLTPCFGRRLFGRRFGGHREDVRTGPLTPLPQGERESDRARRPVIDSHRPQCPHSGLIFAARTTLPHFSVSSAMTLPKSAGKPASTVPPISTSRSLIFG